MSIYKTLYDWQKQIVDKFKERDAYGLFLDMGLGKTPVSLGFAEVKNCTKVIIITINSKAVEPIEKDGWLKWASKSSIPYKTYTKFSPSLKVGVDENSLLLLNYESLFVRNTGGRKSALFLKPDLIDFIKHCQGHNTALIIDESHSVKNLQSKQTKSIQQIQTMLSRRTNVYTYLLTGTPFTTGYIDLYSQLKLLGHEGTKGSFIDTFCVRGNVPGLLGWQQPIVGYKNIEQLYKLVHRYALTIMSEDVIDLPEQIFVYHKTPIQPTFELFMSETASGTSILAENKKRKTKFLDVADYKTSTKVNNPYYRNIAYPSFDWIADTAGTFWLRARQLSIGFQGNASEAEWFDKSRLNDISQFLKTNDGNYVIFYNYTPELTAIYDVCEKLGYKIDVYCGEVKSLYFYDKFEKQTAAERLTNTKNVIIANFASGSSGLNWQLYHKCVIASVPLFKEFSQGIKRQHRIGSKQNVIYHIFYQANWLDYGMLNALNKNVEYSTKLFAADLERITEIMEADEDEHLLK